MEKYDNAEKLADRLALERDKSVEFFKSISPQKWKIKVYPDGPQWDIHHVLAHLVSAENANKQLVEDILDDGLGAPLDFDIDRFNRSDVERLGNVTTECLLDEFIDLRESTISLLRRINDDDLQKIGNHPFLGMTAVQEIIKLIYIHGQLHIRDMRKLLAGSAC